MTKRSFNDVASPTTALLAGFVRIIVFVVFALLVLENGILSTAFISETLRGQLVEALGGTVKHFPDRVAISTPLLSIVLAALFFSLFLDGLGHLLHRCALRGARAFYETSFVNSISTAPIAVWVICWLAGLSISAVQLFAAGTVNLFVAMFCAGLLTATATGGRRLDAVEPNENSRRAWLVVLSAMIVYTITFTAMNWALWFNLRIPHGDSVMYEEHLWNLTHGKGFRSYLDQGLFLGEHIQVIHVLLIPVYWFWSSHLLLELSETLALAAGAIPAFLIARKYSKNDSIATLLAIAYLLYFPLHYLDIAVDLKTFRPISFGVPLMLWAIYALERKCWLQMTIAFALSLACKEDFAIIIAPLGVWLIWSEWRTARTVSSHSQRLTYLLGISVAVLATAYLLFVVKIGIPWFRSGETVHYARYFEDFGKTPTEIVLTMLTSPQLLIARLITFGSVLYFLRVMVPVGTPLHGWSQLLVGAPLFVLLCLNTIAMQPPIGPYHHFHAPLVPIVIWAACASVCHVNADSNVLRRKAWWICSSALFTSVLFSFSPLSIRFWDPGNEMYWRNQYVMDERAKQFDKVIEQIPLTARVASTDYVHSRLTHFERSYDYSDYPRAVANYEDKVPDDTDFIIIDHRHKHSVGRYDDPKQVRELQRSPEEWEVLPDRTNGFFTILKRRDR